LHPHNSNLRNVSRERYQGGVWSQERWVVRLMILLKLTRSRPNCSWYSNSWPCCSTSVSELEGARVQANSLVK
jgi:hypothetical protein